MMSRFQVWMRWDHLMRPNMQTAVAMLLKYYPHRDLSLLSIPTECFLGFSKPIIISNSYLSFLVFGLL